MLNFYKLLYIEVVKYYTNLQEIRCIIDYSTDLLMIYEEAYFVWNAQDEFPSNSSFYIFALITLFIAFHKMSFT